MDRKLTKQALEYLLRIIDELPELKLAGDEVLNTKTEPVTIDELEPIVQKMKYVLLKYREITNLGRGIAAPQVGILKSVFVTYVEDEFQVFANPQITEHSPQSNLYRELCMSLTCLAADVERSEWIRLKWQDENGAWHEKKFDGFMARLLQHEYAHLQGVLNIDDPNTKSRLFVSFDPAQEKLRPVKTNL